MKRILLIALALITIKQVCNAQTPPYNNPTVHVSVNGSNIDYGIGPYFSDPISPDRLMTNIYNGAYTGDVTIRFAGGDYYHTFKFWSVPNTIQSIRMYGGFNPNSRKRQLSDRDFENYETRFHTDTTHTIWLEGIGYNHPNGWNTCIVDGITLTSDYHDVNFAAMSLVGGDHIVSQCKFEGFYSSNLLIWLETGGNTVTFTNCLFDNNDVAALMALCTHVNLINVTIADNTISDDMFIPYSSFNQYTKTYDILYNYNLYNSIIHGNSNMHMEYDINALHSGYFNVYNSILEDNEGWIVNMGNNYINTDPVFTYSTSAPYSCDYYTSPAIAAGDASYITLCPYYNTEPQIMDFDVTNMDRYWDYNPVTAVDIGAYQNGYDDGYINYNAVGASQVKRRYDNKKTESCTVWSNRQTIYINDINETGANLTLYNFTGQIIYKTSLHIGLNTITPMLNSGPYVARIISTKGEEIATKTVVIQ